MVKAWGRPGTTGRRCHFKRWALAGLQVHPRRGQPNPFLFLPSASSQRRGSLQPESWGESCPPCLAGTAARRLLRHRGTPELHAGRICSLSLRATCNKRPEPSFTPTLCGRPSKVHFHAPNPKKSFHAHDALPGQTRGYQPQSPSAKSFLAGTGGSRAPGRSRISKAAV